MSLNHRAGEFAKTSALRLGVSTSARYRNSLHLKPIDVCCLRLTLQMRQLNGMCRPCSLLAVRRHKMLSWWDLDLEED